MVAALAYYVGATLRFTALRNGSAASLVEMTQPGRGKLTGSLDVAALAGSPLDQQAVNAVVTARARLSGDLDQAVRDVRLLRQLGWRSTIALQNMLWGAVTVGDQPVLMDTLDALLRRERLLGQIYPVLNLMTLDPTFRARLEQRLGKRPPWRRYYFMSASDLTREPEIEGRYLVMRDVQGRGDPLVRNEVAPILPKLIGAGRPAEAFDLWRRHNGGKVTSPLADTGFTAAAKPAAPDALPVPFEWQLGSGSGYFVDAGQDARGSFASIDWDGRGTPVLLSQVTSARAGRYRLDVLSELPGAELVGRFGFRLTCAGGFVELVPGLAGRGPRATLVTAGPVRCDFPSMEMFGLVQPAGRAAAAVLRSVHLRRVGP